MPGPTPESDDDRGSRPLAEYTTGRLLVSVPDLADDNFDRTVVFMVEHDERGALGLVLNRPSETAVLEFLPAVADAVVSPRVFFMGGPVSVGGLMALGRRSLGAELENAVSVTGPIVLIDPHAFVNGDVDGVEAVRLFTGYSGWGPGQLDGELEIGVWHVVDAMTDDVLCADPQQLWRTVMKRQGGRMASQALYPEDLSAN